ncbi:toll/interleukin-1 receptor domain-containing protein [Micromonospora siamensis]|uniref:TIR domain-containing protein n=1 Tax=Micromonospora siamensis TaxID=299152 RepID=A0A1C5IQX4_9ACTN|nr:toll/interleukin-1 receptor domain-containing protein [Micromonospora siamensis]SCG60738.1 TIR domain-containing protein [Micromonospora siamensis]
MLPPVLELYVLWHPDDPAGAEIAGQVEEHFQGDAFTGLIGGAVEVFVRSRGWRGGDDVPRPIPLPAAVPPGDPAPATFVAVVPVLGPGLALACQRADGPWHRYLTTLVDGCRADPAHVGVYPMVLTEAAVHRTRLGALLDGHQRLDVAGPAGETVVERRGRELSQALAQLLRGTGGRALTVFVSHSRRADPEDQERASRLVGRVRELIADTRLDQFFDAHSIQAGSDWARVLRDNARRCALLAVRGDHYSGRKWCQEEVRLAKCAGVPIVVLDDLRRGDDRGSFLMDHVPRVRVHGDRPDDGIRRGLRKLVDECLSRALWEQQRRVAHRHRPDLRVDWWAPRSPEPTTFVDWLHRARPAGGQPPGGTVRILHPDPPLGPQERLVLDQLARAAGYADGVDVLTPRLLAARAG